MNFLLPIAAAILQAGSFTLDKTILSLKGITYKQYIGISFPLIFLVTIIIYSIFRPPLLAPELYAGNLKWLLLVSLGFIIVTNLFYYRALDNDKLGEIQTLDLLHNVPVIIFSSIIFADERNLAIIIPALIASLAIIWSHWNHNHFEIKKFTRVYFLWTLLIAPFGAPIAKSLLAVWNPISLSLVRDGSMALILGPLFSKYSKRASATALLFLVATNMLTTIAWILFYFSYQRSGIVYTLLIFSLQPLLVYFASLVFLKEKFHKKKFIAFLVVLASIAAAQIMS
ncbi:MAG: EamA family transporter [Candidatus Liptonbacteria bacterium]|nr:EamA family transporter [Candidatus Liptonbacteria bacterium]